MQEYRGKDPVIIGAEPDSPPGWVNRPLRLSGPLTKGAVLLALLCAPSFAQAPKPPDRNNVGLDLYPPQRTAIESAIGGLLDLWDCCHPCENCCFDWETHILLVANLVILHYDDGGIRRGSNASGGMVTAPDVCDDGIWLPEAGTDEWNADPSNMIRVDPTVFTSYGSGDWAGIGVIGAMLMHEASHFTDSFQQAGGSPTSSTLCNYLAGEIAAANLELCLLNGFLDPCIGTCWGVEDGAEVMLDKRILEVEQFRNAKQQEHDDAGC